MFIRSLRLLQLLLAVCLMISLAQLGQCQTTLGDVLSKIQSDSEQLTSYIVDIHAVGNYDYTGQAKNKSRIVKQAQLKIDQHIEYSRDKNHAVMALRFQGAEQSKDWLVFGESDGVTFVKNGPNLRVGDALLRPVAKDEYACRCTDPRAIGYMTQADLNSNRALESMLKAQRENMIGSMAVRRQADQIKFEIPSLRYTFDAKRGYRPTEMQFDTGGQRIVWTTELDEVSGHWLPVRAQLEIKNSRDGLRHVEFKLDWKSINEPFATGHAAEPRLLELIE